MSSSGDKRQEQRETLHIDDGWKEQARREKERLARELSSEPSEADLPPASFSGLVEELSWRALLCLGQMVDPRTGEVLIDLPSARYVIDLLEVLAEKTRGNLDKEEDHYLSDVVHNLRLAYVEVARSVGEHLERERAGGSSGAHIVMPGGTTRAGSSAGEASTPSDEPEGPDEPDESGPRIIV